MCMPRVDRGLREGQRERESETLKQALLNQCRALHRAQIHEL